MPLRSLPERPNLEQLKLQARELQRAHGAGQAAAAARMVGQHPRLRNRTLREVLAGPLALADCQLVIAREYGFESWSRLKHHVETVDQCSRLPRHGRFAEAVAAFDAGDIDRLRALLREDPSLVRARGYLDPPFGYFSGATLLHHIAGNPYRSPLPTNVVDMTRLLIDAGAEVNARTLSPAGGGTTMGLIITSAHCSEVGASGPLIDLLLAHGAELDLHSPEALADSVSNHAHGATERMIELGASVDVLTAAALGRMDLLRGFFDETGKLTARPRRARKLLGERDAVGLALLHAYVNHRPEAVDFLLEKDGNWNMIGVNNGTVLHWATSRGDLAMVQRLVAKGADLDDRNNPFYATPLSWAQHEGHQAVFDWMRAHCRVDLHDAVCFDLPEQATARLAEDPGAADRQIDQWHVPRSTPLYWAAWLKREPLARLLLDKGANPNLLSGDGRTALDVAEDKGASEVAELIRRQGGMCAAEL